MSKPLTKTEILSKLFQEYGLFYDGNPNNKDNDVFQHQHYKIITRSGIEKIQKAANITIEYTVVFANENAIFLKGRGTKWQDDVIIDEVETFASASAATSKNAYYPEMAEKRLNSRLVLKLAGLYEYGVFGQDEADSFDDVVKAKRSTYKEEN